jgi:hypothetical protein
VALLPRLPGLGRFLTSDENTNIFFAGSDVIAAFLRGDFRATYWHFYPGVTMSWLDALGLSSHYLLDWLAGRSLPPFTQYLYSDILTLLVASRLPYAILTALAIPLIYGLARQLLPPRTARLGALLLAFDPFFLAHSRLAHGDAPVAVFMSLSALAFFIYAGGPAPNRRLRFYLALSAVCGSLAALTKAPGQFMALFVVGLSAIYAGLAWRDNLTGFPSLGRRWLAAVAGWGAISLLTFFILWPSMWVDPLGTIRQMGLETLAKVNEGHLVFFWGQPTLDPGPWFYSYVIPFRLTPVVLLGTLLSLLFFVPALQKRAGWLKPWPGSPSPLFLLWFFVISLLLFANLSPKKQDRYLLPLFPFLNLLAALGWAGCLQLIGQTLPPKLVSRQRLGATVIMFLLLLVHLSPTLTYYPYYLTYFNPLMGGPVRAAKTTLLGWGEGMEQVAAYLNAKPNAASLYVASTPSQTLLPYFAGTGENFYTNDIAFRADYVVLYLAQRQRLAPSPEIIHYFAGREAEATIFIHGVPYAEIYPGPKLILSEMPPQARPVNIGLADLFRLAGYHPNQADLTLYWHALAPISENYSVSVRALTAGGERLAQRDSWPLDGLLPTSLWRPGDYVVDTHRLPLAEADLVRLHHFEVVVYHLDSGQTLGPPLILPLAEGQVDE